MFERYTEKARRVIFFARYEASQLGSPYIETEHLLLGLLREDKQLANRFLRSHAAVDSIRRQIKERTTSREKVSTSVDLPLSHECKRVLAYGADEAERLHRRHVGTEHLLLGLLRAEKCIAAEILHNCGLRLSSVREELQTSIHLTVHDERWPTSTFTLTAIQPKLSEANPSSPTGFHEGPGTDGKDPRIANPAARRLVTCQNMTMAQFAESLPEIAPGYIRRGTVQDATGLDGAWDFTLSFSPAGMVHAGAVSLFEAVEKQLGLKLQATDELPPEVVS